VEWFIQNMPMQQDIIKSQIRVCAFAKMGCDVAWAGLPPV
jgi:hypothetical protein